MQAASPVERLLDGRHLAEDDLEERGHFGDEMPLGLVLAQRLDIASGLDEGVVRDTRHRRMAAAAVDGELERRRHLLRDGTQVERPVAEDDAVAAALVQRVVRTNDVGVSLDEPREPEVLAHLLVGGGGEDQIAGGPEPLPAE